MILPPEEFFSFKEGIIGMDQCILITPNNIKCKWEEETLKFRSMIVRKYDYKIISRGFDKFFNYEEQPDLDKFPDGPFDVIEKKDGSLIIWGIHNGEIIHRTRGTFDASNMANGHEIKFLMDKYPQLLVAIYNNPEYSILTEWQTKTNVIVINEVIEPTLTLVGAIHNETGKLVIQSELDKISEIWGLDRPKKYHYNSVMECISDVELWEGKEGVVLYSEDGQKLRKCKSEWYRTLHTMATGIKGIKQVLDVFMASPKFQYSKDFYRYIETTLDYEIAEKCKDFIDQLCEGYTTVKTKMIIVDGAMEYIKTLNTRKEQAQYIIERCNDWMVPYAFSRLDDKEMDDKLLRKALEQELNL